jgi:hypothetical protein
LSGVISQKLVSFLILFTLQADSNLPQLLHKLWLKFTSITFPVVTQIYSITLQVVTQIYLNYFTSCDSNLPQLPYKLWLKFTWIAVHSMPSSSCKALSSSTNPRRTSNDSPRFLFLYT